MVEWKKLVSVSNVQYGFPFDSVLFTEDDKHIPLIRIRDIKPAHASTYYSGEVLTDYIVRRGDILVGMDGEFNLEKWNDREGLLNQRVLRIQGKKDVCLDGFLYHYLGPVFKEIEKKTPGGSVKHLSAKIVNSIQIPLPSPEAQSRIVSILDTFTASIANLKEQIGERRKQYEHYRNKLLQLEGKEGVEWKTLGEVCEIRKERISASELSNENYVSVENLLKDKAGRVDSENYPQEGRWSKYCVNDILIGNIRPYLKKIWLADRNGGTNGDVVVIRQLEDLNAKYLYYILSSEDFFAYYNQTAKGGKMPRGEKEKILVYPAYLPSLSEQSRIVSILDQFEASIANLEAQLQEREKQYEHYRNQLLRFE